MKQTFSQIMDQIKYEKPIIPYLSGIVQIYDPKNLSQLIPIIATVYLRNLFGSLNKYVRDIRFATENGRKLTLEDLLKENVNIVELRFNIESPKHIKLLVKIKIPEHTETTDFTKYIDNFLELIKVKTAYGCLEYNDDEEYAHFVTHHSPLLYNKTLSEYKEAKRFFQNFARVISKGPQERKEKHMNQPFHEIIEQIKDGTITFHNSSTALDDYAPMDGDQLIYIIVENYIATLIDDLGSHIQECFFKTEYSDLSITELLNENKEATGVYFDINAPKESCLFVEIDFPDYDEETDFEEYITDLLDLIDDKIIERCYEFDADEEFNELWEKSSYYTAREFLEMLDKDEEYFREFADDVKSYKR